MRRPSDRRAGSRAAAPLTLLRKSESEIRNPRGARPAAARPFSVGPLELLEALLDEALGELRHDVPRDTADDPFPAQLEHAPGDPVDVSVGEGPGRCGRRGRGG